MFEQPEGTWCGERVIALSYTVWMPGLVATLIWFWLVQRIGAGKAATFHFLDPFLSVLVAAVLLGETLSVWDIVGVVIIMVGILSVQMARQTLQ